jgi:hypothetical protein
MSKQMIADEVLADMARRKGAVSTADLLEEAKDPSHPLHNEFDWVDSEAAHSWRLEQAARIIRASKYIAYLKEEEEKPKPVEVRTYVADPGKSRSLEREAGMRVLNVRQEFIKRKLIVLKSWLNETVDVPELKDLRTEVAAAAKKYFEM